MRCSLNSRLRACALIWVGLLAALPLAGCGRKPETVPVADYSSPLSDYGGGAASDYSSPLAGESASSQPAEPPSGPHSDLVDPTKAPKIQVVSRGMEILPSHYLVPGKITIFDFYSDFCPPCLALAQHLEKLVQQRPDLYLVKVDINRPSVQGAIDWGSPVAMQFTLRSIPHFIIYSPTGKIMAEGDAAYRQIIEWIRQAEKSTQ